MNEAIARLSTGVRAMYGGDAGGASQVISIRAEGKSALMAARSCRGWYINPYKLQNQRY